MNDQLSGIQLKMIQELIQETALVSSPGVMLPYQLFFLGGDSVNDKINDKNRKQPFEVLMDLINNCAETDEPRGTFLWSWDISMRRLETTTSVETM